MLERFRYRKNNGRPKVVEDDSVSTSSNGSPDVRSEGDSLDSQNSMKPWHTPRKSTMNGITCIPETPENKSEGSALEDKSLNGLHSIPNTPENTESQPSACSENGHNSRLEATSDSEEPVCIRKSKTKRLLVTDSDSDSDKSHRIKRVKFASPNSTPVRIEEEEPGAEVSRPVSMGAEFDHYLYTDKEMSLRIMIQTFPKMDLMKVQETLVKCDWYAKKAIHVLKDKCDPIKCTHVTKPEPLPVSRPEHDTEPERTESPVAEGETQPVTAISETKRDEESDDHQEMQLVEDCKKNGYGEQTVNTEQKTNTSAVVKTIEPTDNHTTSSEVNNMPVTSMVDGEDSSDLERTRSSRKAVRQRIHQLSSDDSGDSSGEVKIISMASLANIKPKSVKLQVVRNNDHDVSSEGEAENENQSKPASSDGEVETKEKKKKKKKKSKRRKKDVSSVVSDDEEDFNRDELYDSDDSDIDDQLTPARESVLNFFRNATNAEILMVPGCSKKKVELIIKLRPFDGWVDLVKKLQSSRSLSTDMLGAARDVIVTREVMTKLMQKCEKIASDMEKVVTQMNTKSFKGICIHEQPSILNQNLKLSPYQMLGLNWLWVMHCRQLNGILADEMGLGKTIQAISFLAHLRMTADKKPRHLVIVPSSTLDNWLREFQTWCPSMEVITYHGSQEMRRELRLQIINDEIEEFDIMMTTYNMISSCPEDRTLFRRLEFDYVVFDEAHMLKNMNSQRYQNLMKIKADRRLLLTGTPLQNNLVELMSLLIFVMPDMFYGKIDQVKQMFASACKSEENRSDYEKNRIEHAKRIMKPFVLRRLKREVLKELPKKHEELVHCKFTDYQKDLYTNLVETFSRKMSEDNKEGISKQSGVGMMMELRKAANHPLLVRKKFSVDKLREMSKKLLNEPTHVEANPDLIFEDMEVMSDYELHRLCKNFKSISSYKLTKEDVLDSGKFVMLDQILPEMKEKGHRFLLFSQFTMMLDIVEEYMAIRNYSYLRLDGSTPVAERQELMDRFNGEMDIFAFLLSTKAGGLGINLTSANVVLLHDIDFNPYNDKQAEDRCHRLGQTREVTVKKMIMKDSIEEAILKCAMDKLKLEKDITADDNEDAEEDLKTVGNLLKSALGL